MHNTYSHYNFANGRLKSTIIPQTKLYSRRETEKRIRSRITKQSNIMKKFIVMAFLSLGIGLSASAETVLMEYYGSKARDSYKNPCKGETIRVCGKAIKQVQIEQGFSIVTETVTDDKGRVINRSSYQTMDKPAIVTNRILLTMPDNAVATIISDNEDTIED